MPDVTGAGYQDDCFSLGLEAMKRLLDLIGRKSEMARHLDRTRRAASIDKVLIDPQPKRGVACLTLPGIHDRFQVTGTVSRRPRRRLPSCGRAS
jgi:hypothetical protein